MDKQKLVDKVMANLKRPHAPFPYLIVRVYPAIYAVATLPVDYTRAQLIELAQFEHRVRNGKYSMCVVFGQDDAMYIQPDGTASAGPRPGGGHVMPWRLSATQMVG